ncbi:BppU family phage baseplate upper protein [Bacillus spizizenii]|uniref:Phage baseplate upper protein n=1 Tax=Bacillus spizizenii TaxID=96241 RepID=A0A9Q4DVI6_BACSC|nr:phage baseplate upper protein [Bacillus spizizenii]MEC0631867.1 BppU family phage baseplate upper protein [Bacillus spizizenii]
MYKQSEYTFNVNTTSQGTYNSAFKFSTQDVGTAKLIFNLRKDNVPLPLSAVTGKLVLVPADGKKRIRDITFVDKVNGIAEYVLDNDEIKMYGTFKAELVLVYSNGQAMSAHKFGFEVTQSLMDQEIVPVAEYYIDDFESLKEKIEELYNESVQTIEELRAKFKDLEKIETKEGAQVKADNALSVAKSYTDTHTSDTTNPHNVTATQIGLSNVLNEKQATKVEFDLHTEDVVRHVTSIERNKWNSAENNAKAYTDTHENRKDNPHDVTKAQVGLDKVDNVQQASKLDFDQHSSDNIRHVTQSDRDKWNGAVTFAKITLKNGTTAGTRTPIYAKWGAFLLLRGHVRTDPEIIFGSIPSSMVPAGGSVVTVPLSGTGGTANLIVYENGDLKIKYPDPTDSSKLGGGYYIDVIIGYQEGAAV